MKKILLLIIAPFAFFSALSVQITQEEADKIVLERMSREIQPFIVYAKEDVQTETIITSANGETVEMDYPSWVYYINYIDNDCRYLIVNESNGNLLNVNIKTEAVPNNLSEWRIVESIEIPFTNYSLTGTSCQWKRLSYPYPYNDTVVIINNKEDLEKYIECIGENDYPVIDFSTHTLLFAHGIATSSVVNVGCSSLQQFSEQSYKMKIGIVVGNAAVMSDWQIPIVVDKLSDNSIIELIVTIKK